MHNDISAQDLRISHDDLGDLSSGQSIYIGCAGWSVAREHAAAFPGEGTHLQRYASRLNGVEINSSFYRPHRQQTYARWADSVPRGFRFCVKVPKQITHERRLAGCEQRLETFLAQCSGLGERLGCLLVQLPPSLAFDEAVTERFFTALREQYRGAVVLEPRHVTWASAEPVLIAYGIAQAAVDPSRIGTDTTPRGAPGMEYWRLHGSPHLYYSPYDSQYLASLAARLKTAAARSSVWCIFDNTASGAALSNALEIMALRAGTSKS
ncbi:DUF72 domain-containing protein [Pseudomonas sp. NFX15]|uniref:DUF72 domain-containing protein n=1 Tax=Pseudomonas sp. NFX15 TaxID=2816958 RepID=UPI003B8C3EBB